jgi:hypothetical protein
MLQGKCTDDPLWLQAAETVHKDPNGQKDCGLAKTSGLFTCLRISWTRLNPF